MAQTTPAPVDSPTRPEVLTLRETADYLRVSEDSVLAAVRQQELPGRQVMGQWRFLRAAVQDWLTKPGTQQERIAHFAGAWSADPYAEEMLEQIYQQRGRPMVEEQD